MMINAKVCRVVVAVVDSSILSVSRALSRSCPYFPAGSSERPASLSAGVKSSTPKRHVHLYFELESTLADQCRQNLQLLGGY